MLRALQKSVHKVTRGAPKGLVTSADDIINPKWLTFVHVAQLGCARFPEFTQNSSERQILWSLCSVDFHTLTLQLPIQTLHSVAPELQVFVTSLENCPNFRKMSTPLNYANCFTSFNLDGVYCIN